jgi:hypothetical protein
LPVGDQIEAQQNIKQGDRRRQESSVHEAKPLPHSPLEQRRRSAAAILAGMAGRL